MTQKLDSFLGLCDQVEVDRMRLSSTSSGRESSHLWGRKREEPG